jgi:hypothetical protein
MGTLKTTSGPGSHIKRLSDQKKSDNEVNHTNFGIVPVKIMLCGNFICRKF